MEKSGLISFVGKVNMDRHAPPELTEKSVSEAEADTRLFIEETRKRGYRRTKPIITPRFVPTCTRELMEALGRIRKEYDLPVQSHLSENPGEIELVGRLCPWAAFYGDVYDRFGLFGGEGNVSIFRSRADEGSFCAAINANKKHTNLPTAVFEVASPIVLGTKVQDLMPGMRCGVCPCDIPECVAECFDGCLSYSSNMPRVITVSVGLFSVVRLERPGQYLVTGTEYAVPEKVCPPDCPEDPCDMFRRMSFPVNEFYPPSVASYQPKMPASSGCGTCKGK
jgi:hypothetical protein